jgi:hypothetical protein
MIGRAGRPAMVLCGVLVGLAAARPLAAQELEPDAYEVAPIGLNFASVSYTFSNGDVAFDPALPFDDTGAHINTVVLSYGRSVNLAGRSGQIGFGVPLVQGNIHATYLGDVYQVNRGGLADPRFRVAINLYGAPAMDLPAFIRHRRRTLFGVSLTGVVPLGQYDQARLINLGTNRWAFRPEAGLSHGVGRWTLELYGGVWLFTTNDSFYRGARREQQPIGTVKMPLGQRSGLRVAVSWGAYTTIGAAFTSVSAAYSYTWGAGI